ncbi:hypothetical protein AB7M49_006960 [Bradyrhizobium elkanii]
MAIVLGAEPATEDIAMTDHKGLPVAGYQPTQSQSSVDIVNEGKQLEEMALRFADRLKSMGAAVDQRRVAIGVTDIEKGFMQLYKAVFAPTGSRIALPTDSN